jgi:autotransporter-associated beta strand protein
VTLGSAVVGLNANLFTGGAFTVANPITVQAQAAGFLFLGGNTASSSAFSGPITVNNSNLYVSQVSGGTVSFTGGITAGSAATTLNFQGPGNMSVSGGSIADNAGSPSNTVAVSLTAGTLTLSSASTYSGGTTVSAGTLYVNNTTGSGTGSGAVNINGGTLAGSGKISGAVNLLSNTNLIPGSVAAPYATLSTGTLSLANNAGFTVTLNSDTTNSNSVLSVTGVASFGAGNGALLSVTDVGTGTLATLNTVYTVVTSNAAVQGAFANLSPTNTIVASNGLVYGVAFNDSFAPAGGGDVTLTLDAVPEPASLGLLGIGGLAMMRRRRRAVKPIASARA